MRFAGSHVTGCLREGVKSYVKPVSARHHGPACSDSRGEDLLALRAEAAVESQAVVADAGREVVVDVAGADARGPQRGAL